MKSFEKFLFYYSIVAITAIFFTTAIFSPTPQNIISAVLLLPLTVYFWLKLTNPESVNISKWSVRFLLIIVILSSFGIFTYFLKVKSVSQKAEIAQNSPTLSLSDISQRLSSLNENELSIIRAELDKLKKPDTQTKKATDEASLSDLLLEADKDYAGKIKTKDGLTVPVEVLKEPLFSSDKVGLMEKDIPYPYLVKENNWYKVRLENNLEGWVNQSSVQEVN